MLNKRTSKKYHVLKVAAVLPLLAIFLWSFNVRQDIAYNILPSETVPELPVNETTDTDIISSETTEEAKTESAVAISEEEVPSEVPMITVEGGEAVLAKAQLAANLVVLMQDLELKITKNTTDAQLKEIKTKIKKEHGIDLTYNVERNSNDEIIRIQLSYSGNGNNGNYSIHDDEGISDFVFYVDDEGRTGFYSEEVEARRAERAYARAARLSERVKERATEREREMRKVREQRERMREEIIVEREAMRDERARQRKELRDQLRERSRAVIIDRDGDEIIIEGNAVKVYGDEDIIADELILREYELARGEGRGTGRAEVIILDSDRGELAVYGEGAEHAIIIDKDTSDKDLSKIRKKMKSKGIEFKYSKVKRNSNGEITGIKITVDNKKGSKKTIVTKADDGEPIEQMLIELE